jgi:hypothetical protein
MAEQKRAKVSKPLNARLQALISSDGIYYNIHPMIYYTTGTSKKNRDFIKTSSRSLSSEGKSKIKGCTNSGENLFTEGQSN